MHPTFYCLLYTKFVISLSYLDRKNNIYSEKLIFSVNKGGSIFSNKEKNQVTLSDNLTAELKLLCIMKINIHYEYVAKVNLF
ncbi:hypothetical protein NCCP28_28610 [Niallia sp. NCCP-28]|nr:hypothetical protein NCCP28_28610 [Niallia sp. NCCP-28]